MLKARIEACLEKKRWHDREVAYRREIERERERADRLLHAILPKSAVAELKASDRVAPRRYEGVAVLFADIVGFTGYSEAHPAEEVVANLDRLIEAGEALVSQHRLEKIKTIGDGLMATANLLQRHADPVLASVRFALAITEAARTNPAAWKIRVGIHVGPVVAGVVGRDKFSFDLWGDTVNVAARLSTLGSDSAVYLSADAWSYVDGRCLGEPLGPGFRQRQGRNRGPSLRDDLAKRRPLRVAQPHAGRPFPKCAGRLRQQAWGASSFSDRACPRRVSRGRAPRSHRCWPRAAARRRAPAAAPCRRAARAPAPRALRCSTARRRRGAASPARSRLTSAIAGSTHSAMTSGIRLERRMAGRGEARLVEAGLEGRGGGQEAERPGRHLEPLDLGEHGIDNICRIGSAVADTISRYQ